jgi:hypothetical protein
MRNEALIFGISCEPRYLIARLALRRSAPNAACLFFFTMVLAGKYPTTFSSTLALLHENKIKNIKDKMQAFFMISP